MTTATATKKTLQYQKYFSRYGIERGATYVRADFTARLKYDALKLQSSVPGAYFAQSGLRHEYTLINREIETLTTGDKQSDRLNSKSEVKRRKFVAAHIRTCRKLQRALKAVTPAVIAKVADLQKRHAEIIKEIRKINSEALTTHKKAASAAREAEKQALTDGRFWECSENTLKNYFNVPFDRRKLLDVSEQFRAALFVELEYGGYGTGIVPTHRAYLCGIDDNGEEWGFRLEASWDYNDKVADAMAVLWEVPKTIIEKSFRQGEIIFWPDQFPVGITMQPAEDWQIAPSHVITSPSLRRSRVSYIYSDDPITVTHPTHKPLILPAGEYRFAIHEADAD